VDQARLNDIQAFLDKPTRKSGDRYTIMGFKDQFELREEELFELLMDIVWDGKRGLVDLKTKRTIRLCFINRVPNTQCDSYMSYCAWYRMYEDGVYQFGSNIRRYFWPNLDYNQNMRPVPQHIWFEVWE
jgi:hypothetical protein